MKTGKMYALFYFGTPCGYWQFIGSMSGRLNFWEPQGDAVLQILKKEGEFASAEGPWIVEEIESN